MLAKEHVSLSWVAWDKDHKLAIEKQPNKFLEERDSKDKGITIYLMWEKWWVVGASECCLWYYQRPGDKDWLISF